MIRYQDFQPWQKTFQRCGRHPSEASMSGSKNAESDREVKRYRCFLKEESRVIKRSNEVAHDSVVADENPGEPPLDCVAVLERVGGDRQLLAELAKVFRQHCPKQLIDLREAIRAGDPRSIEHVSHALRGALSSLGAGPASESAMRLEEMGRNAHLAGAEAERVALEREIARAEKGLSELCRGAG
jgi:HPt (histidine-containing phosphotransfer) domain-containing protein